jgi:hypothetical protein
MQGGSRHDMTSRHTIGLCIGLVMLTLLWRLPASAHQDPCHRFMGGGRDDGAMPIFQVACARSREPPAWPWHKDAPHTRGERCFTF